MEQITRTTRQVGAAIRRRRRALGLSQAQLANRTNLRQATVSALEQGQAGTLRTLTDVLAALQLEMIIRERSASPQNVEDVF